jgi:hypothetical protein
VEAAREQEERQVAEDIKMAGDIRQQDMGDGGRWKI